jgi:hypothetical protein
MKELNKEPLPEDLLEAQKELGKLLDAQYHNLEKLGGKLRQAIDHAKSAEPVPESDAETAQGQLEPLE